MDDEKIRFCIMDEARAPGGDSPKALVEAKRIVELEDVDDDFKSEFEIEEELEEVVACFRPHC